MRSFGFTVVIGLDACRPQRRIEQRLMLLNLGPSKYTGSYIDVHADVGTEFGLTAMEIGYLFYSEFM